MLLSRKYNRNIVEAAILKASKIERSVALQKVIRVKKDRPVLAITYNPMLPTLSQIVTKHWRTMSKDIQALEIFPQPPMVAYRQPPNLKQTLCRAKLPTGKRPSRKAIGMQRCTNSCPVCIHMKDTKTIKAKNGDTFKMTDQFGCLTTSVIYVATCEKCKNQYVGQSGRRFYDRVMDHLRYVKNGTQALGLHYKESKRCDPNRDLKFQVIEKVYPDKEPIRLQREKLWIQRLDSKVNGLNRIA